MKTEIDGELKLINVEDMSEKEFRQFLLWNLGFYGQKKST